MEENKKVLIKKILNLTKEEENKIIDIIEENDNIKFLLKDGGYRLLPNSIITTHYNGLTSKSTNEKINLFIKSDFIEFDKIMKRNIFNVDIRKFISMCKSINIDPIIHTYYDNLSLIKAMYYDDCVSINIINALDDIKELNIFIFGENELDELISINQSNIYMITPNKLYNEFYLNKIFSQNSLNLLSKLNKNKVRLLIDDELKLFNGTLALYNDIQKINYKLITSYEEIQEFNNEGIVLMYDDEISYDLEKLLELISPSGIHITVIDRSNQYEKIIKMLEDNYISSNFVISYENNYISKSIHISILKYILRLQKVFIDTTKLIYIDKINDLINGYNVSILYDNEEDLDNKYTRIDSLSNNFINEVVKIIKIYSDTYNNTSKSIKFLLLNDSKNNIVIFSDLINKINSK